MMDYGGGMMGGMILWLIPVLIFVLAAATAVVILAVWIVKRAPAALAGVSSGPQDPREILRERFATGQIDDEEYRRRLAVLEGG